MPDRSCQHNEKAEANNLGFLVVTINTNENISVVVLNRDHIQLCHCGHLGAFMAEQEGQGRIEKPGGN